MALALAVAQVSVGMGGSRTEPSFAYKLVADGVATEAAGTGFGS